MWITFVGWTLVVAGFSVTLGPVLFSLHLIAADERIERREMRTGAGVAQRHVTICPLCGESFDLHEPSAISAGEGMSAAVALGGGARA